jgi:murein L,D-transpeptidase YcbB/YkuD
MFFDATGTPLDLETASSNPSRVARFTQAPSETNPLGHYRFTLDKTDSIYLHDTSDRSVFGAEERLFSHGCVRVKDPNHLAAWLLDRSPDDIRQTLSDHASKDIPLKKPVPVIITYLTAWPDADGHVNYFKDVYGKNADASCPAQPALTHDDTTDDAETDRPVEAATPAVEVPQTSAVVPGPRFTSYELQR